MQASFRRSGGADGGSLSCEALYLVPQTLYKLHPDFDRLVAGVLKADVSGCVVFIEAFEAATTEGLARRMSNALLEAGVGFDRVTFIRRWVRWVYPSCCTCHMTSTGKGVGLRVYNNLF